MRSGKISFAVKFFSLLLFFLMLRRFQLLFAGLEYDEIWTLIHYAASPAGQIFTDLATPNNHPLNSFFIRLLCGTIPPFYAVRIPAFLAGIGSCFLLWKLAERLLHSRCAALGSVFLFAVNAASSWSGTAGRGYSLQIFFILLYALSILNLMNWKSKYLILLFASGTASVLTLPTSVLYLFMLSLLHCAWLLQRKTPFGKLRATGITYILLAAFMLWYFLTNYEAFRAGQQFGETIDSFSFFIRGSFARYFSVTGFGLGTAGLCSLFLFRDKKRFPLVTGLFCIAAFPYFGAFFTKLGPARVYLPGVPFTAMAASLLFAEILRKMNCRKKVFQYLMIVFPLSLAAGDHVLQNPEWRKTDWIREFEKIVNIPKEYYILYSPFDGLAVRFNNGDLFEKDEASRRASFGHKLLLWGSPRALAGTDRKHSSAVIPLPDDVRNEGSFFLQMVYSLKEGGNSRILCLTFDESLESDERRKIVSSLYDAPETEKILTANIFFNAGKMPFLILWLRKTDEPPVLPSGVKTYSISSKKQ